MKFIIASLLAFVTFAQTTAEVESALAAGAAADGNITPQAFLDKMVETTGATPLLASQIYTLNQLIMDAGVSSATVASVFSSNGAQVSAADVDTLMSTEGLTNMTITLAQLEDVLARTFTDPALTADQVTAITTTVVDAQKVAFTAQLAVVASLTALKNAYTSEAVAVIISANGGTVTGEEIEKLMTANDLTSALITGAQLESVLTVANVGAELTQEQKDAIVAAVIAGQAAAIAAGAALITAASAGTYSTAAVVAILLANNVPTDVSSIQTAMAAAGFNATTITAAEFTTFLGTLGLTESQNTAISTAVVAGQKAAVDAAANNTNGEGDGENTKKDAAAMVFSSLAAVAVAITALAF